MGTVYYDAGHPYDGKDWNELLKAMSVRGIKRSIRVAFRRVGNEIADVARKSLAASLHNGSKMKRNVRVHVFSRGGGFEITVKPHGRQGYYRRSQDGKEKPVAMWAAEGTKQRTHRGRGKLKFRTAQGWKTMKGKSTGKMPAYPFLEDAKKVGNDIFESQMGPEIKKAAVERLRKAGWT